MSARLIAKQVDFKKKNRRLFCNKFLLSLFVACFIGQGTPAQAEARKYEHSSILLVQPGQSLEEAQQQALLKVRYELLRQIARQLANYAPIKQNQLNENDVVAIILAVTQIDSQSVKPVVQDNQVAMQAQLQLSFDVDRLAGLLQNPYQNQALIEQYRQLVAKETQQSNLLDELNQSLRAEPTPTGIQQSEGLRQNLKINQQALDWYQKGLVALEQRDYAKARTAFSNALSFDSRFAEAYLSRALSLRHLEDDAGALRDFQTALQIDPNLTSALINRAAVYSSMKDYEHSIAEYNQLLSRLQDPSMRSSVYFGRGVNFHLLGQTEQAVADYTESIRLRPSDAMLAMLNRAALFQKQGKIDQALADYNQMIQNHPDWDDISRVYVSRGSLLLSKQQNEAALADFVLAERKGLKDAELFYEKGLAHLNLQQALPAVEALTKALALDANKGEYYLARGRAYTLLGNCYLAQQDFKQACSKNQVGACSASCGYGN